MRYPTDTRYWVDEAIQTLGYIKPEVSTKITGLINANLSESSRAIATSYRKEGEQLPVETKRMLGIRANAFMSRVALDELTEKGLANPIYAHEQTILRATLSVARVQGLEGNLSLGVTKWTFLGSDAERCPGCARLNGKEISFEEALPVGPHDCARDACSAIYQAEWGRQSFLTATWPDSEVVLSTPKPWWKFW